MELSQFTFDIDERIHIKANIDRVFNHMISRMSSNNTRPDGEPMPFVLELWPGGRWFRDLGNNSGHLWGHVQVIKPPTLLEICGPMFMSYPATNHISFRLETIDTGVSIRLKHRCFGLIDPEHREGVTQGMKHMLESIASTFA